MNKLLVIILVLHSVTCQNIGWSSSGSWSWASSCDFTSNDMGSTQTPSSGCGPSCQATAGCTHFAWTPPSNCWLKTNPVSQQDAFFSNSPGIVCGFNSAAAPPPALSPVVSPNSNSNSNFGWSYAGNWAWASNCDFQGNDMGSSQTPSSGCGPSCQATAGCTHFAWTPPSNCWLKTNTVSQNTAIPSSTGGIICGLISSGGNSGGNSPPPPPPPPPTPSSGSGYVLVQNYDPQGLLNGNDWDFYTSSDPTHGYVNFLDSQTAINSGNLKLGTSSTGQTYAYMGASATGQAPNSIRVSSKRSFTGGLLLFDALHIPTGCGSWPAFWSFGPNWPNSGEIDVMEGVHGAGNNAMTLHTNPGCNVGSLNCNADNAFEGCGVTASSGGTFGPSFNNNAGGGGIYAMEWIPENSGGIKIWVFPRNSIPGDILSGNPRPSGWPTPNAQFPFGGSCPSNHFVNHNIIIDLTFCGDWAGNTFAQQCSWTGKSCTDYLTNNPSAVSDAYFQLLGVSLYTQANSQAVADNSTIFGVDPVTSQQIAPRNPVNIAIIVFGVVISFLVVVIVVLAVILLRKKPVERP